MRAHHRSACSFHLDVFRVLLSTANYGPHPTVLDFVMVVGYYRVQLTWSLSLQSRHNVAVRSDFVDVLLQFVVVALLGSG